MWVLDTNVVSELFRSKPAEPVLDWFYARYPEDLFVTAISKAESYLGCELMPAGERRQIIGNAIRNFYERQLVTPILAFGSDEADHFAKIVARRRGAGRVIGEFDAQIAAIALSRSMTVATRNTRDFEDCGVALVNPWDVS